MNTTDINSAMQMVKGTCKSMGITIKE